MPQTLINPLITGAVTFWGIFLLARYHSNESGLSFILIFYAVSGLLCIMSFIRSWALWSFLFATSLTITGSIAVQVFTVSAIYWIVPLIVIALYRLKLLHPGLIDLMRLPANKSRSLYLSIVVLAAGIAVYLVAVGVPASKYGVPTSSPAKLFELPLTSVSPTQYQSFLSGFNEEIFRAGYLVNGLSHPLLNALLWAVAHPHSLQRIERRWGVDLSDSPYKNAFLKTVLISYFFAMLLQGLLLLWLMRKTQSVWPSILCHLAHNALV